MQPTNGRPKMNKLIKTMIAAAAFLLMALPGLAQARDGDHDGMPDRWEKHCAKLSVHKRDGGRDADRDGLSNRGEFRSHTKACDADTDNDGREDGDEDADRDRVDNANEIDEGTKPRDRDSDEDGRGDGREDRDRDGLNNAGEDRTGNDPRDEDTDDDEVEDGDEQAGVVASFTNGVLTIDLAGGGQVSGLVTDDTEIDCETEDEHELEDESDDDDGVDATAAHDGSDDSSGPGDGSDDDGDNSGPGSREEREGDEDDVCAPSDLVAGVAVHEAELELRDGQAVFEEVEILK
jgi:hypothetical protein